MRTPISFKHLSFIPVAVDFRLRPKSGPWGLRNIIKGNYFFKVTETINLPLCLLSIKTWPRGRVPKLPNIRHQIDVNGQLLAPVPKKRHKTIRRREKMS